MKHEEIAREIHQLSSEYNYYFIMEVRLDIKFAKWPYKLTRLCLENKLFFLWPVTEKNLPAIIIPCKTMEIAEKEENEKLALRFLSALSWLEDYGYEEGFVKVVRAAFPSSTNLVLPELQFRHNLLIDENDYLPLPKDNNARLSLALYREALINNNVFYKFLGFSKILNIKFDSGEKQKKWINDHIEASLDKLPEAQDSFKHLKTLGVNDYGNHLYEMGRCAISHAYDKSKLVNPDEPKDKHRITETLLLIKALAEHLIESEFKIQSDKTIWREHKHELSGFREVLGKKLLSKIVKNKDLSNIERLLSDKFSKDFQVLSFCIRGYDNDINESLYFFSLNYGQGAVQIEYRSKNHSVMVSVCLNFIEERIQFDTKKSFNAQKNISKATILKQAKFIRELIGNGILEVWSKSGKLLGRTQPYLPNIEVGRYQRLELDEYILDLESNSEND